MAGKLAVERGLWGNELVLGVAWFRKTVACGGVRLCGGILCDRSWLIKRQLELVESMLAARDFGQIIQPTRRLAWCCVETAHERGSDTDDLKWLLSANMNLLSASNTLETA